MRKRNVYGYGKMNVYVYIRGSFECVTFMVKGRIHLYILCSFEYVNFLVKEIKYYPGKIVAAAQFRLGFPPKKQYANLIQTLTSSG